MIGTVEIECFAQGAELGESDGLEEGLQALFFGRCGDRQSADGLLSACFFENGAETFARGVAGVIGFVVQVVERYCTACGGFRSASPSLQLRLLPITAVLRTM